MTNTTTIKVGQMPGRISEYVVAPTATFAEVIALAELSSEGFEVKADGNKVTDLNQQVGSTNLVLLAKTVKGNAERIVKLGQMPGRIVEFAVDSTTTVAEVITMGELNADGYEVKLDGVKVNDLNQQVDEGNLILLAKLVKGNK